MDHIQTMASPITTIAHHGAVHTMDAVSTIGTVALPHPGGPPRPSTPEPEHEIEEHVIDVPTTLYHEKVVEVPKVHYTELRKQVLRPEIHKVMKEVVMPVNEVVERVVHVPQVLTHEQI